MSRLREMIEELCPDGVEYRKLEDVLKICNGSDYKKFGEGDIPVYGSGGIMTYIDTYIYDKPSVLIPRKGSLDKLYYVDVPFWTVDTIFYTKISEEVLPKYVFYYLQSQHLERLNKAGGVPSLTQTILNKVLIPVPPLPIQNEIVKLLDNFTELTAGLTATLTAELVLRKKQYNFYRDSLLNFVRVDDTIVQTDRQTDRQTALRIGKIGLLKKSVAVEWKTLGEVCKLKAGTAIASVDIREDKTDEYATPCYGGNGIRGYVQKENQKGDAPLIGRQGALCGNVCYAIAPYYATEHAVVVDGMGSFDNRFLFHALRNMNLSQYKTAGAQPGLSVKRLNQVHIAVPTIEAQKRIAGILDRFDTLCNDLSQGLPAEIAARKKQYEYYRDKLLTFRRK